MVVDIQTWVKNVANQSPVASDVIVVPKTAPVMSAKAVLICRPNSHPFQERTLTLDQPVKIGRSVARARGTPTNAIFDCKVLSRHHALLWHENGKFFLQDTKSSNGTFVNNYRLSAGGIESAPHEVCSGDIVQFGVDVLENNRKVTHGCIVATLKLYLHDGKEAKASQSLSVRSTVGSVPLDELYKLNQYLQDALQREHMLESKLNSLQSLVEQAKEATNLSWQAFIGEDRLLSRVEILERQLLSYSKNYSEDKIREELLRLQEDKNSYQNSAKESLRKLHEERLDALTKLTTLQETLTNTEEEMNVCKEQREKDQEHLQELAQKYSASQQKEVELSSKISALEGKERENEQKLQDLLNDIESQKDSMMELHKKLEKIQQDKVVLYTLVTELDKCTVNNCPTELKFRVENIINKGITDDVNNALFAISDSVEHEDGIEHKFDHVDNHKENNVPFSNQTDKNKKEENDSLNFKEMEELLAKLKVELKQLQDSTEENDNKSEDLDKLREQISHWTTRIQEAASLKDSQVTLLAEPLDNCEFVKSEMLKSDLHERLITAQQDIRERESTIARITEEMESILEASALVNAKLNLLENELIEEQQNSQKYKKEAEKLKQELIMTQQTLNNISNEELTLKAKVENLTSELNKLPTIETYENMKLKCANLEKLLSKIKTNQGDAVDNAESELKLEENEKSKLDDKFTELEEELVLMKERYAECNLEKLKLNKNLESLQKEYNALINRSHNIIFLYMAPLLLLVAYLLFSSLFS